MPCNEGAVLLSEDYSWEFKQKFAQRYYKGATITRLQHEFGLTKALAELRRERIDQGGVETVSRPQRSQRCTQESRLQTGRAWLRGEDDYRGLALRYHISSSSRICSWVKPCRQGGLCITMLNCAWKSPELSNDIVCSTQSRRLPSSRWLLAVHE